MKLTEDIMVEPVKICSPALIEDIKLAVDIEQLPTEFSAADIAEWITKYNVKTLDGHSYPEITTELLANYSQHTPITKKRKQKVLYTSLDGRLFSFNPI